MLRVNYTNGYLVLLLDFKHGKLNYKNLVTYLILNYNLRIIAIGSLDRLISTYKVSNINSNKICSINYIVLYLSHIVFFGRISKNFRLLVYQLLRH